ncbi:glycosyltransferase, partial [Thiofilum flexile]|uniref:glycosyltransferase n=1 Tax=Thiofilum flexile TaxID=125627 RepID=UPI0003703F6A
LNQSLIERNQKIDSLNQIVEERDQQVASLNQVVEERDQQIVYKHQKLLEMSDWIQKVNDHSINYTIRRNGYLLKQKILTQLPLSLKQKIYIKNKFSLIKNHITSFAFSNKNKNAITTKDEYIITNNYSHVSPTKLFLREKRDIFIFAVIDWHFRIQRPQHLAKNLAKEGYRVFYFSNHFIDTDLAAYQIERLHATDELYQVKLHIKTAPSIYYEAASKEAIHMLQQSMACFIADFSAISSISIAQHAFWYPLIESLPNSYHIYDCMDHHEGFGNVSPSLLAIEHTMLKSVDLVITSSAWLTNFAHRYNNNVVTIRNAGDYDHFKSCPDSMYIDAKNRKIIGYYGAIAEWFDLDLIKTVAQKYSDCLILLIGNDTINAQKKLKDITNIVFTGEVEYQKLPYYLYTFDICLLPFKIIPLTLATNPVKIYEYLSAGKPVVSVDLPEIAQFDGHVLRASTSNEFLQMIGQILLNKDDTLTIKRRDFAEKQTWTHRSKDLIQQTERIKFPLISIIVLTFNNLELTKACLDSLIERTNYPNFEIIVVDNLSTDGTVNYLKEFASNHPEMKVIFNGENYGFAKGNNIGLAQAKGDYLVILNNDTIVTYGWLLTFLRHFQRNPNLGLLGPITNNIGNEAKINTAYSTPSEMPNEVHSLTLNKMGQLYPLKTAAFFCVMMSRYTYEKCGSLSEDYGLGFFEDDDYCRRVELLGLSIACAEDVFIHHHLSASFSKLNDKQRQKLFEKNKEIYEKKWGKWIAHHYRKT